MDSEIYPQMPSFLFNQTLTPKTHTLSPLFIATIHQNPKQSKGGLPP